ncbi:MAG TPA: oligopeptide ABC transporter ATP-binding protein [Clostridiales bacterium]|nr:oligopeptide ABC transporter ATP-binding protein [Clostridiales bacterium]
MGEAADGDILLSLRDLHTWFELRRWGIFRVGWVQAVDGVDFQLGRGEAVAVVGESGCGKTTLARTILGLHPPTRGEIRFDGRVLKGAATLRWYRPHVGFVQQDPYGATAPFLSVKRILEEPLLVQGVRDPAERLHRIRTAMERVKLTPIDDFLNKFPHMLSGGQQQRVVIARAKILEPRLIVADEPVSMLDASVRVEILELLRDLQQTSGLSLIYITHDLSTVRFFTERILVMYGGKVVEEAPVRSLLEEPLHPYTRALLAGISDPDPANAHVMREVPPGEPPSLMNPPSGCRFHPRCPSFIRKLCDCQVPPAFMPKPGHRAACWLHRDG